MFLLPYSSLEVHLYRMFSTTSKSQKHTMHHTKKIMVKFCLKWLFQQTEIMIKTVNKGMFTRALGRTYKAKQIFV